MFDICNSVGGIVYRRLIPQTTEDERVIAEKARGLPEIDAALIFTIPAGDDRTYRVVESLVHESEADQLHTVHRAA